MEATSRSVVAGGSKLRYPLRSAAKSKEGNTETIADPSSVSASKRGKASSSVSKSVNVLDLSGKDLSVKPPRRLSVPSKSNASPRPAAGGSITPISEIQIRRSNIQGKSETPVSDASRSTGRRKFYVLSSISYWLTQIKLSEAASKHSISIGFFKLALESGCEPLQRVREELKSYVCKYNLVEELGQPAKDVLQSYNILEDVEQLKISDTSSQSSEVGTQKRSGSLKPKSLNTETFSSAEGPQKKQTTAKNRVSSAKHPSALGSNVQKKSQKPRKEDNNMKIKSSTKTPAKETVNSAPILPKEEASNTEEVSHEDKENMDAVVMEPSGFQEVHIS